MPFLECAFFGICPFRNVLFFECVFFGICLFWNVLFLECAVFGMCHQNKVGWCCIKNHHNFERNEDRAIVFFKKRTLGGSFCIICIVVFPIIFPSWWKFREHWNSYISPMLFFEQKLTCWPVCGFPPLSQSHSVDDITADWERPPPPSCTTTTTKVPLLSSYHIFQSELRLILSFTYSAQ